MRLGSTRWAGMLTPVREATTLSGMRSIRRYPSVAPGGRTNTVLLAVIAAILGCAALRSAQMVFIPIVFSAFLVMMVQPLVVVLNRYVPKWMALGVVFLLLSGGFFGAWAFLVTSLSSLLERGPTYVARIAGITVGLGEWMRGIGLPVTVDAVPVESLLDLSLEVVGASLMPILTTLGAAILVAFMVVMMLLETESFRHNVRRGLHDKSSAEFFASVHNITRQFQTFFFTKTWISLLTGVVTALFTYAMGIDFPFIWGTLAFLLNYIPNIGSMISVIPPVVVAFVQFEAPGRAFGTGIGLTAVQMVIGNFIDPRAMGRSLSLSPFVVFASMIFWGWMWGLPGVFLSVPLTILIRIVFEHIPALRAVAIMMGGPEPEAPEQGARPIDDDEVAAALSKSAAVTPIDPAQIAR